jgi:hypothetical protein
VNNIRNKADVTASSKNVSFMINDIPEESDASTDKEEMDMLVKNSVDKSSRKSVIDLQRKSLHIQEKSNNFKASDKSTE